MIPIPGWLIAFLTFPGIIVHEIAHRFFCDLRNVPVYEVSYFNFSRTPGYVIHGPINDLPSAFLISVGPLIINSLLCVIFTFSSFIPLVALGLGLRDAHWFSIVLMWFGISIGMHAFPSPHDANNFKELVKLHKKGFLLKTVSWIFVIIISIAHVLRVIWFDLLYAIGLSWVLPLLLGIV
ncbi:MAG: DUF3267 domain-containing protein [Elusimicrobia bacterium]|nr:DUF3267 domain-containing protein [Elusimicrobiota bacterium]